MAILSQESFGKYLNSRPKALNAVELEGFPSNFIIPRKGNKHLLLNIYVDDLTVSGETSLHKEFCKDLRKMINIETEVYLSSEGS